VPKNQRRIRADEKKGRAKEKTLEDVTANQPRNEAGEMVDPHTQNPLDPDWTDLGHKDMTWQERKALYEQQGLTRREVIERENVSSGYWWEDRTENRSRKWDKQ